MTKKNRLDILEIAHIIIVVTRVISDKFPFKIPAHFIDISFRKSERALFFDRNTRNYVSRNPGIFCPWTTAQI